MTQKDILTRVDRLATALRELTRPQFEFIENVVKQFRQPYITIEQHLARVRQLGALRSRTLMPGSGCK